YIKDYSISNLYYLYSNTKEPTKTLQPDFSFGVSATPEEKLEQANIPYQWKSEDETIATVDQNGVVTGVQRGGTYVVASLTDVRGFYREAKCYIYVNFPEPPEPTVDITGIALEKKELTFHHKYECDYIYAQRIPDHTTQRELVWESDDETIATVEENEDGCFVRAIGEGTTTIRAYAKENKDVYDTCNVTVAFTTDYAPVLGIELETKEFSFTRKGETAQILARVTPSDATNQELVYECYDDHIVTVDANGILTAKGNGTTSIWVYAKDSYDEEYDGYNIGTEIPVTVTIDETFVPLMHASVGGVQNFKLKNQGETVQLKPSFYPKNATDKRLKWSSTDERVATIDENGLVTAVGDGKCQIYLMPYDTTYIKEPQPSVEIEVTLPPVYPPNELDPNNPVVVDTTKNDDIMCCIFDNQSPQTGKHEYYLPDYLTFDNITFEVMDVNNTGYYKLDHISYVSYYTGEAMVPHVHGRHHKGQYQLIAKANGQPLITWNVTIEQDNEVEVKDEAWRHEMESQILTEGMSVREQCEAIRDFIKTTFRYQNFSDDLANGLITKEEVDAWIKEENGKAIYHTWTELLEVGYGIDCFGASRLFGDMAKDLGLEVRYVDYATGTLYEDGADAASNSNGHMLNAVLIDGEWVYFDAQPPVY
ncbi:MAG: Ig-like domain-containing protein, partial [Lachnospiraceae bacterium]